VQGPMATTVQAGAEQASPRAVHALIAPFSDASADQVTSAATRGMVPHVRGADVSADMHDSIVTEPLDDATSSMGWQKLGDHAITLATGTTAAQAGATAAQVVRRKMKNSTARRTGCRARGFVAHDDAFVVAYMEPIAQRRNNLPILRKGLRPRCRCSQRRYAEGHMFGR